MPALTRRRDHGALQETWLVYWGDVHAGTIMQSIGNPNAARGGNGGVDPGFEPGETQERYGGKFRGDALGFRNRMARVSVEANRSRLQGMARSARLDRAEICAMGKPANGCRRSGLTA
jgi:hypothetical protein